jgi:formylglycine-generating enzyme
MRNFVIGCIVLFATAGTALSETKEPPQELALDLGGGVSLKLVLIPDGAFMMGSGEPAKKAAAFFGKTDGIHKEPRYFTDEYPQHRVYITKPFYLGIYTVTRGQFRQFVKDTSYETDAEKREKPAASGPDPREDGDIYNAKCSWRHPGFKQTDEHPVVDVDWDDAEAFCKWLSRKEGKTYRLPTEAEWEYACRAGTTTRYYSGDAPESLVTVGNVADAAFKAKYPYIRDVTKARDGHVFTSPVGLFKPNTFGLYDMHGNVNQMCADWYAPKYYAESPTYDPTGPDGRGPEKLRVLRGGCWALGPIAARSAQRYWGSRGFNCWAGSTGFRVAMTP